MEESDEQYQFIFWDGIAKLADTLDSQYRATKRCIDRIAADQVRSLYIHVFFNGDVNSAISAMKPCCLSFSFRDIKYRRYVLAIHAAAQFFPLVFACDLFLGLKEALLNRNVEKIFTDPTAAMAAHAIFLRCFKLNIHYLGTVVGDESEWRNTLDTQESRATLERYAGNVRDVEYVLDKVVWPRGFSLSAAESLSVSERDTLVAVIEVLHRTMMAIYDGEFTVRRYVATGAYSSKIYT